ncbi:hypothetical protein SELMODRAFT_102856, partial [Selaginella moellendorffii]
IRLCEATNSLDSTTEEEILSSLRSLAAAIFIAHRLTTALNCDEVYVSVSFARAGRYAQLWAQQKSLDYGPSLSSSPDYMTLTTTNHSGASVPAVVVTQTFLL